MRWISMTTLLTALGLLVIALAPAASAAPACDRGGRTCDEPAPPPGEPQEACFTHPWPFSPDGRLWLARTRTTCLPLVLP